jgi:NADPH-dependent 7-cyano-7-deazaguanine reductase QueF
MTSILGRTASGPITRPDEIEVWALGAAVDISFSTDELSALCPVTGQPDLYSATISWHSNVTLESKGLKHYLWSFRDRGLSAEDLAITLATSLSRVVGAKVSVDVQQQVRGGLRLTVSA